MIPSFAKVTIPAGSEWPMVETDTTFTWKVESWNTETQMVRLIVPLNATSVHQIWTVPFSKVDSFEFSGCVNELCF